MLTSAQQPTSSAVTLWAGRICSGVVALFLLVNAAVSLSGNPVAVESTRQLGFPASATTVLGSLMLVASLLYLWPRTCLLGAILLTGHLGGAVAIHYRQGDSLGMTLFPALFGAVAWLGLWLQQPWLRQMLPWRRE